MDHISLDVLGLGETACRALYIVLHSLMLCKFSNEILLGGALDQPIMDVMRAYLCYGLVGVYNRCSIFKKSLKGTTQQLLFLVFKVVCCEAVGPHSWGPPLEAASKERRLPWWAQLHQRQNVLQIGNNRIISLLCVRDIQSLKDR